MYATHFAVKYSKHDKDKKAENSSTAVSQILLKPAQSMHMG